MASREELAKALSQMRDAPSFRAFVQTLTARRDTVVRQLLYGLNPSGGNLPQTELDAIRGEARTYDWILEQIRNNTTP